MINLRKAQESFKEYQLTNHETDQLWMSRKNGGKNETSDCLFFAEGRKLLCRKHKDLGEGKYADCSGTHPKRDRWRAL